LYVKFAHKTLMKLITEVELAEILLNAGADTDAQGKRSLLLTL